MSINIIVADDDMLITESMKIIFSLDDRFNLLGTASNGKEAIKLCDNNSVDVALLDVRMPVLNGVDATKHIVSKTNTKVLILTTFEEDDYIREAFKNGATGYLLKNNPPSQIMSAIISVYNGHSVLQDSVMNKLTLTDNNEFKLKDLTDREKEVVEAISKGLTNKEIAKNLYISEGTVKNHITSILSKLELKHRTQIAIYYLKQ